MMPTISPWSACSETSSSAALPAEVERDPADLELGAPCARRRRGHRLRPERLGGLLEVDGPQQLGMGRQLVGRSGEAHGPGLHHVDAVGHRHGDVHRLLHQQDGGAGLAHRLDGAEQLLDDDRRESERELVDQEQLGAGDGRHGESEHLLLAAREVAGPLVAARGQGREGGEGLVDHVGVALAPAPALPGRGAQVLLDAQVGEDPLAAGDLGDAEAGDLVGRQVGDVAAVEDDGAAVGLDHAADGPQQRRLARPVGADQGDDLALADLDLDVGEHGDAVVADAELADGEEREPAGVAVPQHLGPGAHGGPHVADVALDEAAGAGHDEAADDEDGDQDEEAVAEADRVAHRTDGREHEEAREDEERADGEADRAHPGRDGQGERGQDARAHDGQRDVDAGVADEGDRDVGGQREEDGERGRDDGGHGHHAEDEADVALGQPGGDDGARRRGRGGRRPGSAR